MTSAAPRSFRQNRPPARTLSYTEWLNCHPKSCELWRIRTGPILFVGHLQFFFSQPAQVSSVNRWKKHGRQRWEFHQRKRYNTLFLATQFGLLSANVNRLQESQMCSIPCLASMWKCSDTFCAKASRHDPHKFNFFVIPESEFPTFPGAEADVAVSCPLAVSNGTCSCANQFPYLSLWLDNVLSSAVSHHQFVR